MVEPARDYTEKYTFADILSWPEDERWELIDGEAFNMTPAPSQRHQEILGNLFLQFGAFLEGASCRVFLAPFDVLLPAVAENALTTTTVVQPDLTVVCDREKLDGHGCVGSPTLVIEILSPHTARKDLREKLHKYEQVGVKEYWVVYPSEKMVHIFTRDEYGQYGDAAIYINGEQVPVAVLPGLIIDMERVFAE